MKPVKQATGEQRRGLTVKLKHASLGVCASLQLAPRNFQVPLPNRSISIPLSSSPAIGTPSASKASFISSLDVAAPHILPPRHTLCLAYLYAPFRTLTSRSIGTPPCVRRGACVFVRATAQPTHPLSDRLLSASRCTSSIYDIAILNLYEQKIALACIARCCRQHCACSTGRSIVHCSHIPLPTPDLRLTSRIRV
jgi:hypothetical protein